MSGKTPLTAYLSLRCWLFLRHQHQPRLDESRAGVSVPDLDEDGVLDERRDDEHDAAEYPHVDRLERPMNQAQILVLNQQ